MLILKILILAVLTTIFAQDLKYRSVYWFLFPLLVILFILIAFLQHRSWSAFGVNTAINCGFLMLQLLILSAYFSIKNKAWVNITNELLGWGDILLLFCLAFYLSPLNFLLFYIGSLVIIVIIWLIWKMIDSQFKHIPLAGLQSLLFIIILIAGWIYPAIDATNDFWLYPYLMPG